MMDLRVYLVMFRIASFFLTLWLNFDIVYDEEYRQLRSRNAFQLCTVHRKKKESSNPNLWNNPVAKADSNVAIKGRLFEPFYS